jgi:hypothetical protein
MELGLIKGPRLVFFKFLGAPMILDFIVQKVYLLCLMPVCVGLIMVSVYFCQSLIYKWSIIEQG